MPLNSPPYFKYLLEQSTKVRGGENKSEVGFSLCSPDWLKSATSFYTKLYCPDANLTVGGLMYSSPVTTNPKLTISECINSTGTVECVDPAELISMQQKGRIFLFIEEEKSEYDTIKDSNFLLYNFFLVHKTYNRISIQLQVNKEIIEPDYLRRFSPR